VRYVERRRDFRPPDILYAHWLWPGGAVAMALRDRFGWPVAAIARGSEMHRWQQIHPHCSEYVREVIRGADAVLANCRALGEAARRAAPDSQKAIEVVYNGCDAESFAPAGDRDAVRRRMGVQPGSKVMLVCGSITEHKGMAFLARAWERFAAERPDWQLVIVGRPVDRRLVRRLRSLPRTRVDPPVLHARVGTVLQAADAYAQPSTLEGLSNATMEAMATGLPVIATNVGGQGELITHGENGFLLPAGDPFALAAAFGEIAADPGRAARLGCNARDTIVRKFSPPEQTAKLVNILDNTCRAARFATATGGRRPVVRVQRL
jgi:glycosyltransferase involved in cell wall biosynthesis